MVASPSESKDHQSGQSRQRSGERQRSNDEGSRGRDARVADEEYGVRHWGQGEYRGARDERREESFVSRTAHDLGERIGRFFGVGPKGYRRADARIHEDICETLQNHHDIDASEIEVNVKDGVVELSGTVDERRTRRLVEEVIDHIPGIREIENHLRTKTYVARTEDADKMKKGDKPTLHS